MYDYAAATFKRTISLKQDFAEAYNMLGFSLRKKSNNSDTIRNYNKTLELKLDFAETHEYIGEAYFGIVDHETVWKHWSR
jgi:protein O-GlcNAc transferase